MPAHFRCNEWHASGHASGRCSTTRRWWSKRDRHDHITSHRRGDPIFFDHYKLRRKRALRCRARNHEYLSTGGEIGTACWHERNDRYSGWHRDDVATTFIRKLEIPAAGSLNDRIYVRIGHRAVCSEIPRIVPFSGAPSGFRKDDHFSRGQFPIGTCRCGGSDEFTCLDVSQLDALDCCHAGE